MTILWSNNASTTVSGTITAASTSVQLAAGTGVLFPNPTGGNYYVATFYDQATKTVNEIVHVTAMAGDVATLVRAQEGTTARVWNAGDIFANLVTAGTLNAFVQAGVGPANTAQVYVGTDVSATPGTIICPTNPVPASLAVGMLFDIKVANLNPGPVLLQFNGNAGIAAVRTDGSAMVGGNLVAGENYLFLYNGVNFTSTIPPIPLQPPVTTFYVRPDGNDNNSGFANTPTSAFLTISGAMYSIKSRYISQSTITIRVADGTYLDSPAESQSYIASWAIIGNTANPGNVVINATSVSQAAYPPHASIARGINAQQTANISISGFTFQSYLENAVADGGGVLYITNCNFTASTSGTGAPIIANSGGKLSLFGNCQYSGATPMQSIFNCGSGSNMGFGYDDGINSVPLTFNIAGTPPITLATVLATEAGVVTIFETVTSFTGGVPACHQYECTTGGGIGFTTGVTTIFPGTLPGVVTSPGWIA
jgi:hypothetical protein